MSRRVIQVPVIFDSANRRADDSVKLSFTSTKEASSEEMGIYDSFRKSTGWLMYAENEFEISDIPKEKAPEREGKSRSKVLYNVLYLLYVQTHPDDQSAVLFQPWYESTMNKVINQFKDKLEGE